METPEKTPPLEIIEVAYGKTINIGNYEAIRIDYRARVLPGQTSKQVMAALKAVCAREESAVREEHPG